MKLGVFDIFTRIPNNHVAELSYLTTKSGLLFFSFRLNIEIIIKKTNRVGSKNYIL